MKGGKQRTIKALIIFGMILLITTSVSAFTGDTETRENSFKVGEEAKIVVSTDNGTIKVTAGPDDIVDVQATIRRPDHVDYQVTQDNNTVRVIAEITPTAGFCDSPGADITIAAPSDANIDLRTSNGGIEADGMRRSGTLRTSNGEIVLNKVKGEFDANTSNGAIDFMGELTPGGTNRLTTSNGSVNVTLEGTPSVELDAATSHGKVNSELPIMARVTEDNHLVGTIGDGDAELFIRTSNGSIIVQ